MRTFTKSLSGLLSASALAIGLAVIAQPAAAQILTSVHNLTFAVTGVGTAVTNNQVCVFCHTPHGANTAVDAPLWNKALPASTYIPYTSATMDTVLTSASISGVSLACLSCHDGTQARDNMINRPTVTAGAPLYNAAGVSAFGMSTMAVAFGTAPPNLGTDLSNDHAIGMQFCSATNAANALAGTCGDADFPGTTGAVATTGTGRYYVDSNGSGLFEKTDLPLYGVAPMNATVVCATCHDPHATTNTPFLRVSSTNSAICLTCHLK